MKKIVQISKTILFIFVVVLSIGLVITTWLPQVMGFSVCSVRENSMSPWLEKGDWLLAKPVALAEIQVDDILVFEDPHTGAVFARRIAEVWSEKEQLVTSNGLKILDPMTTSYQCVVGRMTYRVPVVGYPSVVLHSIWGKVLFIALYIIWISVEIEFYRVSKKERGST